MNTANTDTTPPLPDSEHPNASTSATDTQAEARPSAATHAWISQLVVNMNRMVIDADFRKEIEKKIF